ncbi:MAG TPA: Crp/Fnr family transcriptional regulator [Candidatus Limnocylindria bacterium]|jgi:CRP-like cAMP-binding protein|nr:Crp/Fnr family transcriptional regulator [Candidatus Limnocylindria bacterium]
MSTQSEPKGYKVWALDDVMYGPVDLDSLVNWARDERILPESWVYCEVSRRWTQALEFAELRPVFGLEVMSAGSGATSIRPGVLRRVRVLSDLTDEQLVRFAQAGELVHYPAFTTIMKFGTVGDSVFFVLEGQVRLRINLKGKEILIAVQEAGGVFGQISLFDSGPRVTDAFTDTEVDIFKMTGANFRRICHQHPEMAVPVLLNLGRTLATRIRTDDKHLAELIAMSANSAH